MKWKLKIIINQFLEFFGSKYRYVFYYEGTIEDEDLIDIKFEKYLN